jgi:hypothetical protein
LTNPGAEPIISTASPTPFSLDPFPRKQAVFKVKSALRQQEKPAHIEQGSQTSFARPDEIARIN